MVNLWERLSHICGHRFTSTYGESAVLDGELTAAAQTWATGIRGVTGAQIAKGLHVICGQPDEWPTLQTFLAACTGRRAGKNEYGLDHVPEYYRPQPIRDKAKLLSSDERDARRAKAKEKLDQLRQSAFGGDKNHG